MCAFGTVMRARTVYGSFFVVRTSSTSLSTSPAIRPMRPPAFVPKVITAACGYCGTVA